MEGNNRHCALRYQRTVYLPVYVYKATINCSKYVRPTIEYPNRGWYDRDNACTIILMNRVEIKITPFTKCKGQLNVDVYLTYNRVSLNNRLPPYQSTRNTSWQPMWV